MGAVNDCLFFECLLYHCSASVFLCFFYFLSSSPVCVQFLLLLCRELLNLSSAIPLVARLGMIKATTLVLAWPGLYVHYLWFVAR